MIVQDAVGEKPLCQLIGDDPVQGRRFGPAQAGGSVSAGSTASERHALLAVECPALILCLSHVTS